MLECGALPCDGPDAIHDAFCQEDTREIPFAELHGTEYTRIAAGAEPCRRAATKNRLRSGEKKLVRAPLIVGTWAISW